MLLHQAIDLREEWLSRALSTLPADRSAAEVAITELYALVGRRPPRFLWVESPAAMLRVDPAARPESHPARPRFAHFDRPGGMPLASRLAAHMADLRHQLDRRIGARLARDVRDHTGRATAQRMLPHDALREEVPLRLLLEITVGDSLRHSVHDTVAASLRTALNARNEGPFGLLWTGQHETHWIARYDVWRRLGLIPVPADLGARLDLWATLEPVMSGPPVPSTRR
ncbi:hypothetical protein [Thermobifida halotolerans]|uniref:hypothetical protein n=1 Tax=Thermobifida halotolerans TaxID=483545 RepID=UPI0011C3C524|nr:hypothetical protein [Thermobifida halotolerans]